MKTLLLDNYDSFTFNLYHAIAEVSGAEPLVYRNDAISWEDLREIRPDAVVISPGPGRPDHEADFGICARVIRELDAPVLGVCLGHQGITHAFGGAIVHAPEPVHGRLSRIFHDGQGLFAGVPQGFEAVRYHSLVVEKPLPDCLEVTAWTDDDLVMGLRHRSRPLWGVQFHPESICTAEGKAILVNFYRMLGLERKSSARSPPRVPEPAAPAASSLAVRKLPCLVSPETLFRRLFAHEPYSFWLDNNAGNGWGGSFSFMGGSGRDCAEIVRYSAADRKVRVERNGRIAILDEDLWTYLKRVLAERALSAPELPFDFNCGYVGYFGYELKADCGSQAAHASSQADATLLFTDRQVAVDHRNREAYALWYEAPGPESERQSEEWFRRVEEALSAPEEQPQPKARAGRTGRLAPVQSRETYIENIRRCLESIRNGESYEICLTNQLHATTSLDPLDYYEALRRRNPAPHSVFLRFGPLAVASSSPERFLRVARDRTVETKPIKGTAPRGKTPGEDDLLRKQLAADVKNRAENLMIVDLLRNDLGRVCEIGSVAVPKLMDVESFATTHQLVSTVTGKLRADRTAVDCLRNAFPGGSMTGAPKLRTLEIIDRLESEARGIYSGSIGYLALNGSADLNIVIRTAVFEGQKVSIGAGGAIVAMSDPAAEWEELLLKTKALAETFQAFDERQSAIPAVAEQSYRTGTPRSKRDVSM